MIDRITIGAACLMASLSGATVIARMWPAPSVRAVVDEVTLETLRPPWPAVETPEYGVLEQGWRWCPNCIRTEPSVRNKDGWLCGHCTNPIPADGVGLGDAA